MQKLSSLFHGYSQTRLLATSPTHIARALHTLHRGLIRRQQCAGASPVWLIYLEEDEQLRHDEQIWQSFRALVEHGRDGGLFLIVSTALAGLPSYQDDEPLPRFRTRAAFALHRKLAGVAG